MEENKVRNAKCPRCKGKKIMITKYKKGTRIFFSTTHDIQTNSSELWCLNCKNTWRTSAKYVDELKKALDSP